MPIEKVFIRTPHNYDRDEASDATGLRCEDKTLTQQQFKDECDINVLFARYMETGELPQVENGLAYGDFTGVFDFQSAMNAVRTAEGMFSQLPARIKNRFDNQPQKLLDFLQDPENREEAQFLGILKKPDIVESAALTTTTGDSHETRAGRLPETRTQAPAGGGGATPHQRTAQATEKPGRQADKND